MAQDCPSNVPCAFRLSGKKETRLIPLSHECPFKRFKTVVPFPIFSSVVEPLQFLGGSRREYFQGPSVAGDRRQREGAPWARDTKSAPWQVGTSGGRTASVPRGTGGLTFLMA